MIRPTYYEFFAGGGMVRTGLGSGWRCLFANDFDAKKAAAYRENWGGRELKLCDIAALTPDDLPGRADLAWASFPCQDLSLAGAGKGLKGERSGTFFAFIALMQGLAREGRAPRVIALENVIGLLTSNGGADFKDVVSALAALGYGVGAMTIDAAHFAPQSRPRVFVVAVREAGASGRFCGLEPAGWCSSAALERAVAGFGPEIAQRWRWWAPARPTRRNADLAACIETDLLAGSWHGPEQTARLVSMMSAAALARLEALRADGRIAYAAAYRRTRPDGAGGRRQRVEIRTDGLAGCLRTPAGGSSRQLLFEVCGERTRSRLITPREAARLMGLGEAYRLPAGANDAYRLLGDGVSADVVRYLEPWLRTLADAAGEESPKVAAA